MIGPGAQHDDPVALATQVRALLDRQHELLVRLDDLSRRQMTLIEADKGDRLLELIDERQHVVDRLREATGMLDPLRAVWAAVAPLAPAPSQEAIRSRTEAVASLLDQIGARDEDARRRLAKRRDEIATELLSIGRGRGALAAYAGVGGPARPTFQDREA